MLDVALKEENSQHNSPFPHISPPPLWIVASRRKREASPAGPGRPAGMMIRLSLSKSLAKLLVGLDQTTLLSAGIRRWNCTLHVRSGKKYKYKRKKKGD